LFRRAPIAVLALFAFGAFAASGAYAVEKEEESNPRILCLVEGCNALEGTLTGGASELIDLNEKTITSTAAEALVKGCGKSKWQQRYQFMQTRVNAVIWSKKRKSELS
jgi:hypothetical protein